MNRRNWHSLFLGRSYQLQFVFSIDDRLYRERSLMYKQDQGLISANYCSPRIWPKSNKERAIRNGTTHRKRAQWHLKSLTIFGSGMLGWKGGGGGSPIRNNEGQRKWPFSQSLNIFLIWYLNSLDAVCKQNFKFDSIWAILCVFSLQKTQLQKLELSVFVCLCCFSSKHSLQKIVWIHQQLSW